VCTFRCLVKNKRSTMLSLNLRFTFRTCFVLGPRRATACVTSIDEPKLLTTPNVDKWDLVLGFGKQSKSVGSRTSFETYCSYSCKIGIGIGPVGRRTLCVLCSVLGSN
jgi:hypothetical protein